MAIDIKNSAYNILEHKNCDKYFCNLDLNFKIKIYFPLLNWFMGNWFNETD